MTRKTGLASKAGPVERTHMKKLTDTLKAINDGMDTLADTWAPILAPIVVAWLLTL